LAVNLLATVSKYKSGVIASNKAKSEQFKKIGVFLVMRFFRNRFVAVCFLAIAGITFINMTFLLAEVSVLEKAYDKTTLENIARMISSSMAEEEQDASESSEGNQALQEMDFLHSNHYHLKLEDTGVSNILKIFGVHSNPHPGYFSLFTPPPDRS
jgi:hypothetical protein